MTRDLGRMRAAMAMLLVASALLFGAGILIERGTGSGATTHVETTAPPAASPTPHVESSGESGGEAGASAAPGSSADVAGEATGTHNEAGTGESIFGIDPEAPPLAALAIILSLVAAFLVWRDGRRVLVAAAIVIAVGFAVLDVLEVRHQATEGTMLVAVLAVLVAVGHLIAAAFGANIVRRQTAV